MDRGSQETIPDEPLNIRVRILAWLASPEYDPTQFRLEDLVGGDLEVAETESLELCLEVARKSSRIVHGRILSRISAMGLSHVLAAKGLREKTLAGICSVIGKEGGVYMGAETVNLFTHPAVRDNAIVRQDILDLVARWEALTQSGRGWTIQFGDINRVVVLAPEHWYRTCRAVCGSDRGEMMEVVEEYLTAEHGRGLTPAQWADMCEFSEIIAKNPPPMTNTDKARIAAAGTLKVRAALFGNLARR